jgi:hypothetical protein
MDNDDNSPSAKELEGYRKMLAEEKALERKQIADVVRTERAYRRANNIPLNPKTHPGYYHMGGERISGNAGGSRGGGGGGGTPLGRDNVIHTMNPLKLAKGGKVGSASKRADGMALRGKTRGKMR